MELSWHRFETHRSPKGHGMRARARGKTFEGWQDASGRWRMRSTDRPQDKPDFRTWPEARAWAEKRASANPAPAVRPQPVHNRGKRPMARRNPIDFPAQMPKTAKFQRVGHFDVAFVPVAETGRGASTIYKPVARKKAEAILVYDRGGHLVGMVDLLHAHRDEYTTYRVRGGRMGSIGTPHTTEEAALAELGRLGNPGGKHIACGDLGAKDCRQLQHVYESQRGRGLSKTRAAQSAWGSLDNPRKPITREQARKLISLERKGWRGYLPRTVVLFDEDAGSTVTTTTLEEFLDANPEIDGEEVVVDMVANGKSVFGGGAQPTFSLQLKTFDPTRNPRGHSRSSNPPKWAVIARDQRQWPVAPVRVVTGEEAMRLTQPRGRDAQDEWMAVSGHRTEVEARQMARALETTEIEVERPSDGTIVYRGPLLEFSSELSQGRPQYFRFVDRGRLLGIVNAPETKLGSRKDTLIVRRLGSATSNPDPARVVLFDEDGSVAWRGSLADFLAENRVSEKRIRRHLEAEGEVHFGGGAQPLYTLARDERAANPSRVGRRRRNGARGRKKNGAGFGAFLGSLVGSALGMGVGSVPLALVGSVVGGAAGGHYGAPSDRRKRGAIGGTVGSAVAGPIGAAVGGYVGGRKPDRKNNPRRRARRR